MGALGAEDTTQAGFVAARLTWLMGLRVVIITALLGATLVFNYSSGSFQDASPRLLLASIAATYFLTIVYALWFRMGRYLVHLAYLQCAVDALLFAVLTYATGGVSSGFTFLFHLWVIMAAVAIGARAAFVQATISATLLTAVAVGAVAGWLQPPSDQPAVPVSIVRTAYWWLVNASSLYLVAALVAVLLRRLESARQGLQVEKRQKQVLAQELEHAKRLAALGELAATLAHEIRNPLSAVSGSFQLLFSQIPLSDRDRDLVDIIDRELDRMGRMVDDILEYTKPREPTMERIDLAAVATDVVVLARNSHKRLHIALRTPDNPAWAQADPAMIRQVLWNLLANAATATGGNGHVEVVVHAGDDAVYVQVADDGPGVPEALRADVFKAFFTTKRRGMGLGLALCARVAQMHGGRIELLDPGTDTALRGAVFRLTIPTSDGLEPTP